MQQISLPKRLIPVLPVKVNIGFEIWQHREIDLEFQKEIDLILDTVIRFF
jgi:hypothetical protein